MTFYVYLIAGVLLYIFLIPGMYTLVRITDLVLGSPLDEKDKDMAMAAAWPIFLFFVAVMFITILLVSPFAALIGGRDVLDEEWGTRAKLEP